MSRVVSLISRNLNANLAFLIHTPEMANHYALIWDEFNSRPFDVILHGDTTLPVGMDTNRWPAMTVRHVSQVLNEETKYELLVSNQVIDIAVPKGRKLRPLIKLLARSNLRMMYAAGKTDWNLADWNRLYDGVLCFGPKHAQEFSNRFDLSVFEMGYPRFDRFFKETPDLTELGERFGCDPSKPTVVWLPTWRGLSSTGHFNDEIAALRPAFNVVLKVHPLMPENDPESVARLQELGLNAVITDATDNVPLYQMADYMLFDYGGPPFGGIYTDKRFVLLNVPDAENDTLTGAMSSDVLLRRDFANVNPGSNGLRTLLCEGDHWDDHKVASDRLRAEYFASNFGTSAEAAADAITNRSWVKPKRKIWGKLKRKIKW